MDTSLFIERSKLRHGVKYSYDKVNYINSQTKVILTCDRNHEFMVRPDIHLNRGDGCRKCKNENMIKTSIDFINRLSSIFGNFYEYQYVEYKGIYNQVKLICKNHGEFHKKPSILLKGKGCPICFINRKLNTSRFIEKANIVHKQRYDYSLTEYKNSRTKVKIICKNHGVFEQLANNHMRGHGCKLCDRSKGEIFIENYLISKNIDFETEFKFSNLRFRYPLRFDVAVFRNKNLSYLIEFHGKQHYQYYPSFHKSEEDYKVQLIRDNMKIEYCKNNNIKLYIISYIDNIEEVLKKIIKENEKED